MTQKAEHLSLVSSSRDRRVLSIADNPEAIPSHRGASIAAAFTVQSFKHAFHWSTQQPSRLLTFLEARKRPWGPFSKSALYRPCTAGAVHSRKGLTQRFCHSAEAQPHVHLIQQATNAAVQQRRRSTMHAHTSSSQPQSRSGLPIVAGQIHARGC